MQAELEKARDEQRLNVPAKRILEKIQGIPSDVLNLQRRWFWELLQNASDYNDQVEVILELHPDKVVFKHNGKPFRPIDTENLIAPDSGKDDEETRGEDMIGQFGTGFISTHVLASKITVEGIIKSEVTENSFSKFTFNLDRSGFANKELLKSAITASSQELNEKIRPTSYVPGSFDTVFTYHVQHALPGIQPGQAIQPGLEYVFEVLPYTLAFMPKIKKVTIENRGTDYVSYAVRQFTPIHNNGFSVFIDTRQTNDAPLSRIERHFKTYTSGLATVIIGVENGKVLPYPENLTKLFCSLPMIGTEEFASPIAINSSKFVPKTERNGIRLSSNDHKNREIMSSASIAYMNLANMTVTENIQSFFNICRWSAFIGEVSEKEWYKTSVIDPIKRHLLNSYVVQTSEKTESSPTGRITLGSTKIPYFNAEELKKNQLNEFYWLCSEFMPGKVPVQEDFLPWFENLDFSVFTDCKYELKNLTQEVEALGSIEALGEQVTDAKPWLSRLITLALVMDESLLDQYKVIPNQLGEFLYRKDDLNYDEELDTDLIEIYNTLTGSDYRSILLDPYFEKVTGILKEGDHKSEIHLTKDVDDALSSFEESQRSDSKFQKGLRLIFKWFAECGKEESELKDLFKWFSGKKPQLFLETVNDGDREKVLSIAQSGKLESLAKIANSELTDSDITRIAENIGSLDALAKVLEDVPNGMSKLLEYAKMLKQVQDDFELKQKRGKVVELVFEKALKSAGVNASVKYVNRPAYDFEIINQSNGKQYFIELKSYWPMGRDPFRLSINQAKKSVSDPNIYSVVTIETIEELELIDENYVAQKTRCRFDVNTLVKKALEDYQKLDEIRVHKHLHLAFRDEIRVNIPKNVLLSATNGFDALVSRIKTAIT